VRTRGGLILPAVTRTSRPEPLPGAPHAAASRVCVDIPPHRRFRIRRVRAHAEHITRLASGPPRPRWYTLIPPFYHHLARRCFA
jgi:hypothetical protein